MSEKTPEPTNVISIARALELPAGATEQDAVAAAVRLRQLEVQVQALTGAASTAEAMGALRAMKEDASKYKASQEELVAVKLERDLQNFEALIAQANTDRKLNPAEQKFEREQFEIAVRDGRGAAAVDRLRGYLAVKSADPRVARDLKQPQAGGPVTLTWNGKAYRDLKPMQRAQLAQENPELWRLMKADHEAPQTA